MTEIKDQYEDDDDEDYSENIISKWQYWHDNLDQVFDSIVGYKLDDFQTIQDEYVDLLDTIIADMRMFISDQQPREENKAR